MLDISLTAEERQALLQTFPHGVIALDLETTGLGPTYDKIIEIGAIKILPNGEIKTLSTLINPGIEIPAFSTAIHHITNDMVKDSPSLASVLPEFVSFIENFPIVAHNAKFDIGFFVYAYHVAGVEFSCNEIYDSCRMGRTVFKTLFENEVAPENYKLGTLANYFNINLESYHRATDDALACLKIFAHTIRRLEPNNLPLAVKHRGYLFKFDDFKKNKEYDIPEKLKPIIESILQNKEIEIEYRGGTTPHIPRKINPVSFLPMPFGLVLYAKCLQSNMMKSFSVKKIKI